MDNDILSEYISKVESVLEENPVLTLEHLLGDKYGITAGEFIQLSIKLKNRWEKHISNGVEGYIILIDEDDVGKIPIIKYDFHDDIKDVVQNKGEGTCIYYINKHYEIVDKRIQSDDTMTIQKCSEISANLDCIIMHLGINGVDTFISGKIYDSDNFMKSYKDMLNESRLLSIYDYDTLIHGFYEKYIEYDIQKRYFVRACDVPKVNRKDTINKYNKLLRSSPEELFQMDFARYLRTYCKDTVIREYLNISEDKCDILVLSAKQEVYIIEIKWLGRSISSNMTVFNNYNTEKRAIEGAYQLQDYIQNADHYKDYFLEYPVYCGILLIFDARDEDKEINYPDELKTLTNIVLDKRLFMKKEKINASEVYNKSR